MPKKGVGLREDLLINAANVSPALEVISGSCTEQVYVCVELDGVILSCHGVR